MAADVVSDPPVVDPPCERESCAAGLDEAEEAPFAFPLVLTPTLVPIFYWLNDDEVAEPKALPSIYEFAVIAELCALSTTTVLATILLLPDALTLVSVSPPVLLSVLAPAWTVPLVETALDSAIEALSLT